MIRKIRERSGLLIGIIGIAMLAFIATDLLSGGRGALFGGRDNSIGSIAGEPVKPQTYERYVQETKAAYKMQNQQDRINAQTEERLRDQAWNNLVLETLLARENEDLGIKVPSEELFYMVQGPNPHPTIVQAFTNPQTGEFDRNQVLNFLRNLDQIKQPDVRERWYQFEEQLAEERLRNKYFDLIRKAFYVTDLEARQQYIAQNQNANIDYAYLNANTIADSAVSVSESAIEAYYQDHQGQYQQEKNRDLVFAAFDIVPSAADTQEVREEAREVAESFRKASRDSLFIRLNSDLQQPAQYVGKGEIQPDSLADQAFSADSGTVFGPYLSGGGFEIYKVMDIRRDSQPRFHARHILIKTEGETEADSAEARQKIQALKRQVEQGAAFDSLARAESDGPSSRRGGDLGWFSEGKMVPAFTDAIRDAQAGELRTAKTRFGFHLIEVLDDPSYQRIKWGKIVLQITPGEETYSQAYQQAATFRQSITSLSDFNDKVREMGLNKRIAEDIQPQSKRLPGLPEARALVRWAFNAQKEGAISDIIELPDHYVVAALTSINEGKYQPLEDVRPQIVSRLRLQAKRDQLAQRFEQASTQAEDLAGIAEAAQADLRKASQVNLQQANLPGVGRAPKLIGFTYGCPEGALAGPVGEANTVFMVHVNSFSQIQPPEQYTQQKKQLVQRASQQVVTKSFQALKELANVEDRRFRFY